MLQAVSERLVARGHAVTVLTLDCVTQRDLTSRTGAGLPSCDLLNGVKIIRVSPSGGGLLRAVEWWMRRRGGWRSMRRLLGDHFDYALSQPSGLGMIVPLLSVRADVVATCNWHFDSVLWVCDVLQLRRVPHLAIPVLHIDRPWAQRNLYARLFKTCAGAIVLTDAEQAFVHAKGLTSAVLAGGGVEPSKFDQRDGAAIKARYNLGNSPVVGFIGRQDILKGVPTLIEAMQIVWRHAPQTVLLLAGPRSHRDRATSDKLQALSDSERQRVVLIDDFDDKEGPSIIEACDLLAQPSVEEAFGLVLLEAWMCEKPVIGADIAATRGLVDHGGDGWLVVPFDAEDLAAKIASLLADRETRATFGRRGRAKVLSRYTWNRITDIWEATYRTVAKGADRPRVRGVE
jgi:glycosyltransferase involved in cell wall biosynthesis